jgi:D-erythro-7,8-dihydroneopterin triphosphate epimerase
MPAMPAQIAKIRVSNLRLRTFIGFNTEEREKQQDVVINLEVEHEISPAAFDDEVEAALNYKTITKAVISHVENGRFLLLERLVNDVLTICSADPAVIRATVTIDKPHALRFADSVSVTLGYDRSQHLSMSENPHDYERRPLSQAS